MNMKTNKTQTRNMTVENNNNNKINGADKMNMKFTIESNDVEITSKTGNNMKYMVVINNRRAYLKAKPVKGGSEDEDESYDAVEFLVRRYYVNGIYCSRQDFFDKIIMFFVESFKSEAVDSYTLMRSLEAMDIVPTFDVKPASADYVPGATKVPYTNYAIPEGFDAEANELNFDNTISLLVDIKPQVKSIIIDSLYSVADRVFNLGGRLCKAPHVPNRDELYDEAYYGKFEVGYRFCNWDGTPSLWNE